MLNLELIEKSTPWEIQTQIEFLQHDINYAEDWLQQLKRERRKLQMALCVKTGGHRFHQDGVCDCGAKLNKGQIMSTDDTN